MAHFAATRVGGMHNSRIIIDGSLNTDDLVRLSRLTLGSWEPMWILWTITLQIDGVAGIGIRGLGRVTEYAHLDAASRSAVEGQLIMTPVATLGSNHITHQGHWRAVGYEVESCACVVRAQVELVQVTRP